VDVDGLACDGSVRAAMRTRPWALNVVGRRVGVMTGIFDATRAFPENDGRPFFWRSRSLSKKRMMERCLSFSGAEQLALFSAGRRR